MSLLQELNLLKEKLIETKINLIKNLNSKNVNIDENSTLNQAVDAVKDVQGDSSGNFPSQNVSVAKIFCATLIYK